VIADRPTMTDLTSNDGIGISPAREYIGADRLVRSVRSYIYAFLGHPGGWSSATRISEPTCFAFATEMGK